MTQSSDLFQKSQQVIPGGVNSPVRAFRAVDGDPLFISKGQGCRITTADGQELIDFCNSWGPLILGHADPDVVAALQKQIQLGTSFGAPTELEYQLAELITKHTSADMVRLVSSGTEAAMSALRLARGVTGRSRIVKFNGCYHGHADSFLVKAGSGLATFGTASSAGVPEELAKLTVSIPLGSLDLVDDVFKKFNDDVAAVCVEGIPANNGFLVPSKSWVQGLAAVCQKHNVPLLFDEVITGFRLGMGGAAAYYGIEPDLVCYGKVIGGGLPVGAFGGKKKFMERLAPNGDIYQAGTLSGNPLAVAAGLATLGKLQDGKIYDHLEKLGQYLEKKWAEAEIGYRLVRVGSIFWVHGGKTDPVSAEAIDSGFAEVYAKIHPKLIEAGVYMAPSAYEVGFLSAPMTEKEVDSLVAAWQGAVS